MKRSLINATICTLLLAGATSLFAQENSGGNAAPPANSPPANAQQGGSAAAQTPVAVPASAEPVAVPQTERPDGAPPPGATTGRVAEQAPAEPRRTARDQAGTSVGEFAMSVDVDARMLRIHGRDKEDRQDLSVMLGEEFVTDISLANKVRLPFDEVRVILSYDTEVVEPLAINDSGIANSLKGNPTAEVDPAYGMILYEAQLKDQVVLDNKPILSIRWKAKKVTMNSRIEFSSRENFFTALNAGGKDILGSPKTAGDGTLDLELIVLPEDPREAEALLTNPSLYTRPDEKMGGVKLFLRPQEEAVMVGKPFKVDLVLDNRAFSMLDGMNALIAFDPSVLTILDVDKDNWITRETNIHDGSYRSEFPWDFHIDNSVYQNRGLISYRVGTTDGSMTRGTIGTIATIHAVAKRPTAGTPLTFRFSKRPQIKATSITYVGQDALGNPREYGDGATGVVIPILPEPPAYASAGNKDLAKPVVEK